MKKLLMNKKVVIGIIASTIFILVGGIFVYTNLQSEKDIKLSDEKTNMEQKVLKDDLKKIEIYNLTIEQETNVKLVIKDLDTKTLVEIKSKKKLGKEDIKVVNELNKKVLDNLNLIFNTKKTSAISLLDAIINTNDAETILRDNQKTTINESKFDTILNTLSSITKVDEYITLHIPSLSNNVASRISQEQADAQWLADQQQGQSQASVSGDGSSWIGSNESTWSTTSGDGSSGGGTTSSGDSNTGGGWYPPARPGGGNLGDGTGANGTVNCVIDGIVHFGAACN